MNKIVVPLQLPEDSVKAIYEVMLNSAKDAFKQASEQQSYAPWMTLTEAAKYMHVSKNTLTSFIEQGLRISVVNGVQRISQTEANRFYQQHQI